MKGTVVRANHRPNFTRRIYLRLSTGRGNRRNPAARSAFKPLMLLFAGALLLVQAVSEPPAMRRAWTAFPGNDPKVIGARGDAVFYTSRSQVGALDKRTGRTRWSIPRYGQAVLTDSRLIVQFSHAGRYELASLDPQTGKTLYRVPQLGYLTGLVAQGSRVYVLRSGTQLTAYDETLRRRMWTREFAPTPPYPSGDLVADGHTVVAAVNKTGMFAFDAETGAPRWKAESEYPGLTMLAEGRVTLSRGRVREVRDARTGDVLWDSSPSDRLLGVRNGVAYVEQSARIQGYDWKTGALLWDRPGGTNVGMAWPRTYPAVNGDGLWILSNRLRSFAADGTERWAMDVDLPTYADADLWATQEENRILGYRAGRRPEVPTHEVERETLAQDLVRNYEALDAYERDLLVTLAPHGGEALLVRFADWAAEVEKGSPRSLMLGEMLYRLERRLFEGFRPEQTDTLLRTIDAVPRGERYQYLDRLMLEKGDLSRPIPGLLRRMRDGYDDTLAKIAARSTDPGTVEFIRKALLDPNADPRFRREAYVGLATTGGAKGRAAILKVRPKQATKGTWLNPGMEGWSFPGEKYPRVLKDAKGRRWKLAPSWALGHPGDLFVSPQVGSGWGKAIYTGVFDTYGDFGETSPSWKNIPIKKFLTGAWIKVLPKDRSIRSDRDGDGLTDLVEARLGLDAHKKDTDGDGVPDGIDLCPNAKPRPIGDREKIMRAAIDAFHFAQPQGSPVVMVAPPGVAPFEIYRAGAPLLWLPFETPLFSDTYGPPRLFFSGHSFQLNDAEWLQLSPGGKRATTFLNTGRYEGSRSLEVTLEKQGTEWFVTALRPAYSFTRKQP